MKNFLKKTALLLVAVLFSVAMYAKSINIEIMGGGGSAKIFTTDGKTYEVHLFFSGTTVDIGDAEVSQINFLADPGFRWVDSYRNGDVYGFIVEPEE